MLHSYIYLSHVHLQYILEHPTNTIYNSPLFWEYFFKSYQFAPRKTMNVYQYFVKECSEGYEEIDGWFEDIGYDWDYVLIKKNIYLPEWKSAKDALSCFSPKNIQNLYLVEKVLDRFCNEYDWDNHLLQMKVKLSSRVAVFKKQFKEYFDKFMEEKQEKHILESCIGKLNDCCVLCCGKENHDIVQDMEEKYLYRELSGLVYGAYRSSKKTCHVALNKYRRYLSNFMRDEDINDVSIDFDYGGREYVIFNGLVDDLYLTEVDFSKLKNSGIEDLNNNPEEFTLYITQEFDNCVSKKMTNLYASFMVRDKKVSNLIQSDYVIDVGKRKKSNFTNVESFQDSYEKRPKFENTAILNDASEEVN